MSLRSSVWAATLLLAGTVLAACAGSAAGGQPAASAGEQPAARSSQSSPSGAETAGAQVVTLHTGDYYFRPDQLTLRPGQVTLTIVNEGPRRHAFAIRNTADTDDIFRSDNRIVAGESETLTFTLTEPGRYKFYCPVPGHAERGELGYFTVAA